jgi:hypothetical protein
LLLLDSDSGVRHASDGDIILINIGATESANATKSRKTSYYEQEEINPNLDSTE